MVTLLHISDLHFGRAHASKLADAILEAEDRIRPHAVVCSGDLVEWSGTDRPWREVRAFLQRLVSPRLVIPGNHDIERLNLFNRLIKPLGRYRRFVHHEPDPVVEVPGAVLAGIGTPRRWSIDLGHVSTAQLNRVRQAFAKAGKGVLKVVAMHHGLLTPHRGLFRGHVWGAERARRELLAMGADLVLSGHSHFPHAERLSDETGRSLIWAQAGTAGSPRYSRRRCLRNSFSVIRRELGQLLIEWWYYDERKRTFEPQDVQPVVAAAEPQDAQPLVVAAEPADAQAG